MYYFKQTIVIALFFCILARTFHENFLKIFFKLIALPSLAQVRNDHFAAH